MFLHDWNMPSEAESLAAMKRDFEITDDALNGVKILLATYTYEAYEGDAFVLFERDGNLFEVNGGHCSCYGLEGQWEPEETSVAALERRLGADFGSNRFADDLRHVLASRA